MNGIIRGDYRVVRSSDAERVKQVEQEFEQDVRAYSNNLSRMYEAWDVYWSINGSGWERKTLAELRAQNRHPAAFNICAPKVDTLAGTLVSDLPDSDWVPTEGPRTTNTESIRHTYRQDREMCDWEAAIIDVLRDGLVHEGWGRMLETREHSPRGNIGLERIIPGYCVPGSGWKTGRMKDLHTAFIVGFLPPEALAFKYQKHTDAIMRAVEERKRRKTEMPAGAARLRQMYQKRVGDEYMIIENHWTRMIRQKRLVAQRRGTNYWIPFPLTEDQQLCLAFAEANDIDMSTAYADTYTDQIHEVTTVVPELDPNLLLENGKSKIQTRNLGLFNFTVTRYNGESKGIVAEIMDTMRTMQERIVMESDAISKGTGGADLWNSNLFLDEQDWHNFLKNKNKFGHAMRANLDDVKMPRLPVTDQTRLTNANNQISMLWEALLPLLSRVSDSMSAITDTSKSGILFEREYQINRIGNLLMDKGVKQMINNLGEAYFWQWQLLYKGEPREIATEDGGRVVLNERVPMGVDAKGEVQYGVRNSVEHTPRCRVIITENVKSSTQQMYRRHMYREALEALSKNPDVNMAKISVLFAEFAKNLEIGDDAARGAMEAAGALDDMWVRMKKMMDMVGMKAQMKGSTVQALQYENMLRQMMAQMGQGMMPAQGAPIEEQIIGPQQMIRGPTANAGGQIDESPVQAEQPIGRLPPPPSRGEGGSGSGGPGEGGV